MSSDYGGDLAMMDFDLTQSDAPVQCPLCYCMFVVSPDSQPLQRHLFTEHRLVISKINEIADLRQYLMYWGKLDENNLVPYCTAILTNSNLDVAQGEQQLYFLLSEHLPEDLKLRSMLQDIKLKSVTRAKELERADTSFSRKCVYCYEIVGGGLHNIFSHLTNKHSFSIGKPDNIVFGAKLLDAIEEKFQNLLCLYCEKKFNHHEVLRIHMRKKGHRTLNPDNRFYDQFYLINYLQPGTPWQEVKKQRDDDGTSASSVDGADPASRYCDLDEVWMDWREDDLQASTCLFCPYTTSKVPAGLLHHMAARHHFDMTLITRDFSFYDKVKAVNYIRTKVLQLQCPACCGSYCDAGSLQDHLNSAGHCKLPTPALWCSQQYLQPVLPEDGLLYYLEDVPDGGTEALSECQVFGEDIRAVCVSPEVARELTGEAGIGTTVACCLFCRHRASGCNAVHDVIQHMHSIHAFDLYKVTRGQIFYEQVKLINYIRLMTGQNLCYYCHLHFSDPRALEEHRTVMGHTDTPDEERYQDDRFLSPVIPDDPLLQSLEEDTWTDDSDLDDDLTPPHLNWRNLGQKQPQGNTQYPAGLGSTRYQTARSSTTQCPTSRNTQRRESGGSSSDQSLPDLRNVSTVEAGDSHLALCRVSDAAPPLNNSDGTLVTPEWRKPPTREQKILREADSKKRDDKRNSGEQHNGQFYTPPHVRDDRKHHHSSWRQNLSKRGDHTGRSKDGRPGLSKDGRPGLSKDGRPGLSKDGRPGLSNDARSGLSVYGRSGLPKDSRSGAAQTQQQMSQQSSTATRSQQLQHARGEIHKHYQEKKWRSSAETVRQCSGEVLDAAVQHLQQMCLDALDVTAQLS